ncbi:MAG: hypothetical protein FJ271_28350 [Planctomycetes bacterium]|nr:hypothetical protein [Planctomycetota bacterium]
MRFALLTLSMFLFQAGAEPLKSGPQVGTQLPGALRPVAPLNINGKHAGRHHCLVCQNDVNPAIMVFVREPAEGKDEALATLLKKLEQSAERHQKKDLGAFVIVLSPAAHTSATNSKEEDTDKIIEETAAREALLAKLKPSLEGRKHVVVAIFPKEGPKGYDIAAKADVTIVFYQRFRVLANAAFAEGQMQAKDLEAMLKKVDERLGAPGKGPKTKRAKKIEGA